MRGQGLTEKALTAVPEIWASQTGSVSGDESAQKTQKKTSEKCMRGQLPQSPLHV